METTSEIEDAIVTDGPAPETSLTGRVRSRLSVAGSRLTQVPSLARAQWTSLPQQAGDLTERVAARLRDTLDLPRQSDIDALLARIDGIDAAVAALMENGKRGTKAKKPAKPAKATSAKKTAKATKTAKAKSTGDTTKAKRKTKIKQAAAKSGRKKS